MFQNKYFIASTFYRARVSKTTVKDKDAPPPFIKQTKEKPHAGCSPRWTIYREQSMQRLRFSVQIHLSTEYFQFITIRLFLDRYSPNRGGSALDRSGWCKFFNGGNFGKSFQNIVLKSDTDNLRFIADEVFSQSYYLISKIHPTPDRYCKNSLPQQI